MHHFWISQKLSQTHLIRPRRPRTEAPARNHVDLARALGRWQNRTMPFDLQGHRGARGLKPENTLPSFEVGLDVGVSTIETDVHLTRDGVPVLCHDPVLGDSLATLAPGQADPRSRYLSQTTLLELRRFRVDRNPDPRRFPEQDNRVTPAAERFAQQNGFDPYAMPTVIDLIHFADAYAGSLGAKAGKAAIQC